MDESNANMASTSSNDDSKANLSFPSLENIKQEKFESSSSNFYFDNSKSRHKSGSSLPPLKEKQRAERTKRPYTKKQKMMESGGIEKPPPKKRGRKSKKEMSMMSKKSEYAQEFQPTFKKPKIRSPSQQKSPKSSKRTNTSRGKKSGHPPGPSVFDKKFLVGPHLTMKQVLEYILTDHSYCVPPDPLPAVGSNHQMIRYILGPKNGAKAKPLPTIGLIEPGERSPIGYSGLSRARAQLSMSSISPSSPSSKLENLLKRGDSSPLHLGGSSMRLSHSKNEMKEESDLDIDVETVDPEPEKRVAYDVHKAKEVMTECEKYVEFARDVDTGDNWEAKIVKTGWTKSQGALFDKVIGALHAERLARLTYESAGDTEPVLRRASLDKTACRVRRIFGEYLWDTKLSQWLHSVLTEFLNFAYLAIYMDVLQTLKSQCPHLISRMMKLSIITPLQSAYGRDNELEDLLTPYLEPEEQNEDVSFFPGQEMQTEIERDPLASPNPIEASTSEEKSQSKTEESDIYLPAKSIVPQVEDAMVQLHSAKNAEAFRILLERQWDPFSPDLLQRLKKLSANPIFLVIAPGAIFSKSSLNRRLKQYHRMFNRIGKFVKVRLPSRDSLSSASALGYLEKMMFLAKEKIKYVRHCFPDRPLFLVGWGSGSVLAARLSITAGPVDGIVALGFPLHSLREVHDDVLKIFGGIKHPILFVIGGLASNNSLTDMELFRRRLACETSLVVVGSGNENLYVSRDHREKLLITQSYVDKTVMDEVAYFVNLHSKHNQIIATNISMKPHQFSKSQHGSEGLNARKSSNLLRGKKRKSSFNELDPEAFVGSNNDDSKDSYDSDGERHPESNHASSSLSVKREVDSAKPHMGSFDYNFDGPKFIPSNKSSNKRKAYYRPDPTTTSSSITSSSCITASKLLQQSPNAKRRMSKPSGPSQRVPLLNQQPPQRSNTTPMMDIPKDDPAALYKYLSTGSTQSDQDPSKSKGAAFPLVLRQNEGQLPGGNESRIVTAAAPYMGKSTSVDKTSKKKSKSPRLPKTSTSGSPTSAIVSALSEVTPPASTVTNSTPPSSLDMHKFVVQHQQMLRQFEQSHQDRPQSSQLFKLLSPGSESSDNVNVSSMPTSGAPNVTQGAAELMKLKLIGSQAAGSSEVAGEPRTAVITKQNLVSNMSLPMIRLSRTEENSQQKPVFVTGTSTSGSTILASLPSDASEKILLRTGDKSVMKLNAADLKNLIAGGRGIQLFTGVPSQGPVNIIVKKPQESVEPKPSVSSTIPIGSVESAPTLSPTANQVSAPSVAVAIPEATKSFATIQTPSTSQVEGTNLATAYDPSTAPEETKCEDSSDQQMENEPMDVDTEEEMSGLLISNTFSVCPTSGQRVLPESSTTTSNASLGPPGTVNSSDSSSTVNMVAREDELLSVPIHVQGNVEGITGLCPPTESMVSDESLPTLKPETTSMSAANEENRNPVYSCSLSISNTSRCTPEAENSASSLPNQSMQSCGNDLNPVQPLNTVTASSLPPSDSTSTENNQAPSSSSTKQESLNDLEKSRTSMAIVDETEMSKNILVPADPSGGDGPGCAQETEKSFTSLSNMSLDMMTNEEELITVPIHVKDSTFLGESVTSLSKSRESSEAQPSAKDEESVPGLKATTASDEDKRKSKNNPVRRSARLKSGV